MVVIIVSSLNGPCALVMAILKSIVLPLRFRFPSCRDVELACDLNGDDTAGMNRDDLLELYNLLSLASSLSLKAPLHFMSFGVLGLKRPAWLF